MGIMQRRLDLPCGARGLDHENLQGFTRRVSTNIFLRALARRGTPTVYRLGRPESTSYQLQNILMYLHRWLNSADVFEDHCYSQRC